jgi:hypothetical protein|tara:strand:+ start:1457 stop:1675 length:219 start_codon:yes stop_codon:yes gene_type:complete
MSLTDNVIDKIEAKILESVQDNLEIVSELETETLILTIKSLWQNTLISINTLDMNPFAEELIKRMKEEENDI